MLYEIAIVEKPTKKASEDGAVEKLIYGPKPVVAKNEQAAIIGVLLGEDAPKGVQLDRVEVLVRPFAVTA